MNPDPPKIEFPCAYPIKVMGEGHDELQAQVMDVILRHCTDFDRQKISTRDSSRGRWRSITVMINATGQAQIESIFNDLKTCSRVRMVL
tara:strand:- start:1374 stop:1640 length:267 start_codon:yes stop_codon:yes gene_type:complete